MNDIILDGLQLSPDLIWKDRNAWSPVVQTVSHTLTGAIVVETGAKLKGRKITLVGEQNRGFIFRSLAESLQVRANNPGLVMVLVYKSETFDVMFDHSNGSALNVEPMFSYTVEAPDDYFKVNNISLIVV